MQRRLLCTLALSALAFASFGELTQAQPASAPASPVAMQPMTEQMRQPEAPNCNHHKPPHGRPCPTPDGPPPPPPPPPPAPPPPPMPQPQMGCPGCSPGRSGAATVPG